MPLTSNEIVSRAYEHLGLKAENQALSAVEIDRGRRVLASIYSRLEILVDTTDWTIETVPDAIGDPLTEYLASKLAPGDLVQAEPTGRSFARLLAALRPDNRTDLPEAVYY